MKKCSHYNCKNQGTMFYHIWWVCRLHYAELTKRDYERKKKESENGKRTS